MTSSGMAAAQDGAKLEGAGGARLIDGSAIARTIRAEVAAEASALTARGVRPGLAVVIVGEDPASMVYVRNKERASAESGMHSEVVRLPADTSQAELLAVVSKLNADPSIHGFLVQAPLPKHIDPETVIRHISPEKDVDGFHAVNVGKLLIGDRSGFAPCTPAGVHELLVRHDVSLAGAEVVMVGRSNIVGKPMAALMLQSDATITVCHRDTRDLAFHTRRADVLIVAVGRPKLITADMVRPGVVVIDVGINRVVDPRARNGFVIQGDVDFPAVREVASLITPVPGGVGPMTIAMLLKNTVRAARQLSGLA